MKFRVNIYTLLDKGRWQGSKTGRLPFSPSASEYGTAPTEHLLNASKRPQTFKRQANLLRMRSAKDKDKYKRDKGFQDEDLCLGGVMKEEISTC